MLKTEGESIQSEILQSKEQRLEENSGQSELAKAIVIEQDNSEEEIKESNIQGELATSQIIGEVDEIENQAQTEEIVVEKQIEDTYQNNQTELVVDQQDAVAESDDKQPEQMKEVAPVEKI